MCNQRINNERSGDSTRETYNQINNWPDSSRFKFASINVFSDNITCRRNVMNAWPDNVLSYIFLAKTFYNFLQQGFFNPAFWIQRSEMHSVRLRLEMLFCLQRCWIIRCTFLHGTFWYRSSSLWPGIVFNRKSSMKARLSLFFSFFFFFFETMHILERQDTIRR